MRNGTPHREPGPQTGGRRRILVVDDEEAVRILCRLNLESEGLEVLEAADGTEAVELALAEAPDLVLLDVMLPALDGWDVARALAANDETAGIPIVFLTACADPADRRLAESLGAVAYVTKPFDPVELGRTVAAVLD